MLHAIVLALALGGSRLPVLISSSGGVQADARRGLCPAYVVAFSPSYSAECIPDSRMSELPSGPPVLLPVAPSYPEAARKAQLQGWAVVDLRVSVGGDVAFSAERCSFPMFAGAAHRAAAFWRFLPSEAEAERCATLLFEFVISVSSPLDSPTTYEVLSPHHIRIIAPRFP